eukprot:m.13397 g.13397  ORF g.13397 m.13397 type:complete len:136 (-) comp4149_c0_seq1:114-521(-)
MLLPSDTVVFYYQSCTPHTHTLHTHHSHTNYPSVHAGGNMQHKMELNAVHLEDADDLHHKHVSLDVGHLIMKGRNDKGWTQKELSTKINEKPHTIQEYEAGKGIPNQAILAKIERQIGIKLRGKNIGQPLGGPKK